ncbi:MAG: GTPase domain-containing protein [Promethearchaeia archaeon]
MNEELKKKMSTNKIVFVGPPEAGKSTLRKIFFEGENPKKLLEYGLEPTYGIESLVLEMQDSIGVFDLSGQENKRWLETKDKKVFYDTKLILIVIDVKSEKKIIEKFVNKVLTLRNELTPSAMVYLFIHKIDLVDHQRILDLKERLIPKIENKKGIKVVFTSIKKEYFQDTLSIFLDLLKICQFESIPYEKLNINLLEETFKVLNLLNENLVLSKKELILQLNRPKKLIEEIMQNLLGKEQIKISNVDEGTVYSLTDEGKNNYQQIIENVSIEDLISYSRVQLKDKKIKDIPPFIGCIVSDDNGRMCLKIEVEDGALAKYISQIPRHEEINQDVKFDISLIPMFISAIQKFAREVNIQNLASFNLKGSNLKMNVFNHDKFLICIFMNPKTNFSFFRYRIRDYFNNIFEKYSREFRKIATHGSLEGMTKLKEPGRKWLNELNKSYTDYKINLKIYDEDYSKELYNSIDQLYEEINQKLQIELEKVKQLKINLMKGILENDLNEISKVMDKAQEMRNKIVL